MRAQAIRRAAAPRRAPVALSVRLPSAQAPMTPAAMPAAALMHGAQRRGNSFIKQVMEQVKKDMEADPERKKDWEKAQRSADRMSQTANRGSEKLETLGESLKSASLKTSEMLSAWKARAEDSSAQAQKRWNEAAETNENVKKASEAMKQSAENVSAGSQAIFGKAKGVFAGVMDTTSKAFSKFGDEDKRAGKLKEWKAHRDTLSAAQKAAEDAKDAAEAAAKAAGEEAAAEGAAQDRATASAGPAEETAKAPEQQQEQGGALVVSEASSSSWDRFGAGLRDMPFLSNMFENPLFDRVFGESEIAASIREMKEIDYNFHLEDFAEDIEYIVAPHIIKTYLEGDQEALKNHCGEAAFAAVNASIKARQQQKLSLDTNILAGPREVVLAGAKLDDKGPPCFIWTFQMQQINCLRDKTGEIIEGAVDDIRTVCYAMVVQRHPKLEELSLEYPWQISELAILWNQPCL